MASTRIVIDSLKQFYNADDLSAAWQAVFAAYQSKQSLNLHINQRSRDGGNAAAILLSTSAEQLTFMESCQQAIKELTGDISQAPGSMPSQYDYSRRIVGT